jgi:glutathionylspermidine synthase
MQRIACPERDDWRITADETGFDFHTLNDERYWTNAPIMRSRWKRSNARSKDLPAKSTRCASN